MPFTAPDTDEEVKQPQASGFVGPDDELLPQQPVIPQAETQPEDDSSLPPLASILAAGQRTKTQQGFANRPTPVVTADESDAMARDINTPFTDPAQMKTAAGAAGAQLFKDLPAFAHRGGSFALAAMSDAAAMIHNQVSDNKLPTDSVAKFSANPTEPLPAEEGSQEMTGVGGFAERALVGGIKMAPAIGASAGLSALRVPATISAALPFAFDDKGNPDIVSATLMAALPGIGKFGENATAKYLDGVYGIKAPENIAKTIYDITGKRISEDTVSKWLKAGGNQLAANTALLAAQSPDIIKSDDPARALGDAVFGNLAPSLLGFIGHEHEPINPDVDAAARQALSIRNSAGQTQPTGEPNATTQGNVQESIQPKRAGNDEVGPQAVTGGSGSVQPAAQVQEVAQPNPPQAINPQAATAALTENMQGRSMEISKSDLNDPQNPHLKKVIADWNAKAAVTGQPPIPVGTTWAQLSDAGVIQAKPTEKGVEVKVTLPEPPSESINPGGSQEALPPEAQAKSKANNSREAFLKANGGVLPTAEVPKVETPPPVPETKPAVPETIPPKVETKAPKTGTEALATAGKVRVEPPEGATFIRGTTADGKASVQPVSAFAKFNPFKDAGIEKIEAGTKDKTGKFTPMKGDVGVTEVLPKDKSFGGLTDIAERPVGEGEAMGAEAIKEMVSNPKFGFNGREADVASALLTRLEKAGMDLGKLRVAIRQNIEGGFAGMSQVAKNLIELSGRATAATFPHEMFHFLFENLPANQRSAIGELRLEEIRKIYGDNIPDKLRNGTMSSDEFLQSGLPHSQYPLINDSEFLASFAGEKFSKETFENRNAPSTAWTALRDKVQNWIRIVVRTAKEFLRVRPDLDSIYQDLLNGRWQPTPETGLEYEQTPAQRQGSLMTTPRQLAEVSKNLPQLEPEQQELIQRSAQEQNAWTRIPSINYLTRALPEGVKSKLKNIFQGRIETASEAGPQKAGPPVNASTIERILNDPSMTPDQRMLVVKDIVDNNILAENQIARKQVRADAEILKRQNIIVEETERLRQSKDTRDIARNSIKSAISDYQNQQAEGRDAARNQGAVDAFNHAIAQVEGLKDGSEALERVFNEMERTVPAALLENPSTTAKEIVDEFRQGLSDAELGKQLGITPDMVTLAAEILSASKSLATDIEASKYSKTTGFAQSVEELTKAAAKPDKTDLRKFVGKLREPIAENAVLNKTIPRSNQRLARALGQYDDWSQVKDTLQKVNADPEWKAYRDAAYKVYDVRKFAATYDGSSRMTFKNPLSGETVEIPTTLEVATQKENIGKLKALLEDAKAYLADPTAPNYDPRTAAAWRHMLENADGYWLNPDINPAMPRLLPYWLELPAWLRHPLGVLRTLVSGSREGREVQTKLNALSNVKKQIEALDKSMGVKVGNANQRAAMSHNLSLDEWNEQVFKELAGRQQYLGQIAPKVGERLISGETLTGEDVAALQAQKAYTDGLRKLAEEGQGNAAVGVNPSRVVKEGYTRKAGPTSGTGATLPQYVSQKATTLLQAWRGLRDTTQQIGWLNQPDNFRDVVLGHIDRTATPKYAVPTTMGDAYKGIMSEVRSSNNNIHTVQDVVDYIFDHQTPDIEEGLVSKQQIQRDVLGEIEGVFKQIEKYRADVESERAKPKTSVYTADNAFTKARAESPTLPYTLMDYGAVDSMDRMQLNHDAMAWYVLELLGKDGAFDRLSRAFQDKQNQYEVRAKQFWKDQKAAGKLNLFPSSGFPKSTQADVKLGNELYDYNQVKQANQRIRSIQANLNRIYTQDRPKWDATVERLLGGTIKGVGANVLMTPLSRITHTGGNLLNWGFFYKKMGDSLAWKSAGHIVDLATNMVRDIALKSPDMRAAFEKAAKSNTYGEFVRKIAQTTLDREAEIQRLRELGIVGQGNTGDHMAEFGLEMQRVTRNTGPESTLGKAARLVPKAVNLASGAALEAFPGFNDAILNSAIPNARIDLVNKLKSNAAEYLGNRKTLAGNQNYTDLTNPNNFLTPQELTGSKDSAADYEARRLRNLFSENGLSLDALMMKYHLAFEDAKANGRPTDQINFLSPGEQATLDFSIGQETGLSTAGTRNLASQGGSLRSALGYIHGLPMWQLGNLMESFNKLSGKSDASHVAAVAPLILATAAYATILGLMRQQASATVNRALFNQASTLPTVANLAAPGATKTDAAKLALRALASWIPVVGDIVNGIVLDTPDRFGHLDSMFLGWNFAVDVMKTAATIGHDIHNGPAIGNDALNFVRRWSPLTRIGINRLPQREGINNYYNSVNDLRAVVPASMESKSRQETGANYAPGPLTPFIHQMLNAAYTGDDAAFQKAYDAAVQVKQDAGAKNPELAVRESFMARNPYLALFRTLPTDQERDALLSRMTPEQQAEVKMSEDTFSKYATQIGGTPALTLEQREANHPVAIGRISGGAGQTATNRPRSSTGPISNVRAPGIGRSTINRIRGRGRSYQLGGGRKGIKAPRLHVVRSRGKTSRNRIRRKRTTA